MIQGQNMRKRDFSAVASPIWRGDTMACIRTCPKDSPSYISRSNDIAVPLNQVMANGNMVEI